MASIPVQFNQSDPVKQLISARKLRDSLFGSKKLVSGICQLDSLFSNVRAGDIIEWGIPPGLNGRLIPLQFLKQDMPVSVWIYHHHNLAIFASSWISHGIDLNRLYFIRSSSPVSELRPLFLEDTFKQIIIDSPRHLSTGDLAFLATQARQNRQIIFLIRHFFLSPEKGNAYAGIRLNSWQGNKAEFSIQIIKGPETGIIKVPVSQLYNHAF
ncbi:MAG: hypothetical protein GY806_15880 [Gammaproteobacteria bacterium]|nr:hypothetical protein [Gammaproteobacteria bacterium]